MKTITFSDAQKRHLLCGFLDVHRRMEELEAFMVASTPSPFSGRVYDLSPTEAKVVRDYFGRVRTAMLGHLRELDIPLDVRQNSLRWIVQANIMHIEITVDDLGPKSMVGYGPVDEETRANVESIHDDLERLLGRAKAYIRQGLGRDLSERLARLDAEPSSVSTLALLERVITRWRLVEYRPALDTVVSRLESSAFEIAVFGRVSSGKSSLLNHICGFDVLPVGVTPVTAVPTRLVGGDRPSATVTIAEFGPQSIDVEEIWEYASEEGNPGNQKHVTNILARYPSSRLREGVVFVDTPGVGSLATEGGSETLAYLPRCDLGVVLIDAASTLNQDDLTLLRSLYEAGVPAMVLLSKADLLSRADQDRVMGYVRGQVRRELGLDLPVHPVSTVGADGALLNQWFEREIAPLLGQHRRLAESSLRRKIAGLRGAVTAALECLLERRQKGSMGRSRIDIDEAQRLLDESDQAIRRARKDNQDWSTDRQGFLDALFRASARALVEADHRSGVSGENPVVRVIRDLLVRRGRMAHESAGGLLATLHRSLEGLKRAAPSANADVGSVKDDPVSGLPVPDLGSLRTAYIPARPLWASLIPPLAVQTLYNELNSQSGADVRNMVELYDRQLQAWAKTETERIAARYEAQAEVFRELIRRSSTAEDEGDTTELEADLRELTRSETVSTAPEGAADQVDDAAGDDLP